VRTSSPAAARAKYEATSRFAPGPFAPVGLDPLRGDAPPELAHPLHSEILNMKTRSGARLVAVDILRNVANSSVPDSGGRPGLNGHGQKLGVDELKARFTELTHLLYDTSVPVAVLREKVYPHLAEDITFRDPWVRGSGLAQIWTGLRGFHAIIRFTFDILQITVNLDDRGRGRVLVDGVMNLNQLVVYTYPLRTILVYEFEISPDGESFQITSLEEMWSLGDLIQNVPVVGRAYEVFRWTSGYIITGLFWISATVVEGLKRE
jgi:hypothetical protein